MSTGKKVLNVFGIIFAWILSIVLVITLYVAPVLLSALSAVKPAKIADTMKEVDISQFADLFGGIDAENETLMKFLSTDAVQELYEVYISGLTGIFENEPAQNTLSEEKIKEIVHNNIDELYQIFLQEEPDAAQLPEAEVKQKAEEVFSKGLIELVAGLPTVEQLRQSVMAENPELQMAVDVFNAADMIKLSYVAVIIVLSALVFVCRIPGFRGLRWIAVDLFVATGLSALVCAGLSFIPAALGTLTEGQPALAVLAQEFVDAFTVGVYVRTGIMLVAGVGMLLLYLFIKKKFVQKKVTAAPAEITTESEQTA